MLQPHHLTKFTPEQMEVLASNPFTYKIDHSHILFTLEFKNLFLSRYENGDSSTQIFSDLGYDINILGKNRVYGFARRLREQVESGKPLAETPANIKAEKPVNIDYNTMPSQQSTAAMQRELTYLRQQVEFLKKITELDNDKKPRT